MSDRRAVSTVIDVALCLLLVSASVGVLATAAPSPNPDDVGPRTAASLVASTTATVDYGTGTNWTARGTLAGLLADAARSRAGAGTPPGFVAGVRHATERALANVSAPVQVVAVWRPAPAVGPVGRVTVGDDPPPGAAVDAVTFAVPFGNGSRPRNASSFAALGRTATSHLAPTDRSRDRLARRIGDGLRRRYESPRAAAANLTADRVRITVRTWSP